jgi:ABC-2 type transport system permease protein
MTTNTQSNAMRESSVESQVTPTVISPVRLMYWSVRRELWENRWIYLAPLAAAAVFLVAFLIGIIALPHHRLSTVMTLDPAKRRAAIELPYEIAAALIMGTALIIGAFYSLDALHSERKDRSILFWKSLPVSDLITVLAKLTIPLLIVPLVSFVITLATQFLMLVMSSVLVLGSGASIGTLWTDAPLFHVSLALLYHLLTVHGLWYAPLFGWLLLVSAWAPRAPLIWAFLPPFVICGVEKLAFNTSYFLAMLERRLTGPEPISAPAPHTMLDMLTALTPGQFFSEPGLWIGLALTAAFVAAAIRLRRDRGPI